jgi:hypothetical protein
MRREAVYSNVRNVRSYEYLAVVLAMLAAVDFAVVVSTPERAQAAKGGTCAGYSVTTRGQTFTGDQKRTIPVGDMIQVRGKYNTFNVRSRDFAVFNYRHTGAKSPRPDKNLDIPAGGVQIFQSKVPLHGKTLEGRVSLEISAEGVVLERSGGGQDMKIQAKDCVQGGLFQMEPEPGTRERNTLGDDFVYTNHPPGEQRLCFTNGRVPGYDSPELATLVSRSADNKTATWRVAAGGRIGMVIGEDAVEGGCSP